MRKMFTAGFLIMTCAVAYVGCDDQQEPISVDTADGNAASPKGLKMPAGTQFEEVVEDGETVLRFKLPVGYTLLAGTEGGGTVNLEEGGIKCTCTGGRGGCSPFKGTGSGGTVVGCIVDATRCTECLATITRPAGTPGEGRLAVSDAVILDRRSEIAPVMTRAQAQGRSCAIGTLLDDPEIVRDLAAAVAPFMGSDPALVRAESEREDAYRVPFDVYGHIIWVPVSIDAQGGAAEASSRGSELVWDRYLGDDEPGGTTDLEEGGGGRCRCESGGGGCTHHRRSVPMLGSVEWCQADQCDTCTLND